jgi:archaellum biogenesis protein FlaJ (TadC family)
MEPFHALSCRHASYRILFLNYTRTSSLVVPFKSLRNNYMLLFLDSFNSILVEVLTVYLSSFKAPESNFRHQSNVKIASAVGDEEMFTSFWVSFILSLFILLSLVIITALLYLNRRRPIMAQILGTIAASLVMMH